VTILAYSVPTLLLLGILCFLQVFLHRRFHRRLNPFLLAATALLVLLTVGFSVELVRSHGLLEGQGERVQSHLVRLWQARAVAADADDACIQAVISNGACEKSPEFVAATSRLADAPLTAANIAAAARGGVPFDGLLVSGIREAVTPEAREAAMRAAGAFEEFVSAEVAGESVIGGGPSQVGGAWNRLDSALADGIASDRPKLEAVMRGAQIDPTVGLVIPGATAAIAGLIIAGLRPRIGEYRA
jgi:hypothetical protein